MGMDCFACGEMLCGESGGDEREDDVAVGSA